MYFQPATSRAANHHNVIVVERCLLRSIKQSPRTPDCQDLLKPRTPDCQDLLSELLIADEDKRIDMDALMKHPWVNDNYPRLEPACDTNTNQDLDIDIVALEVQFSATLNPLAN